MVCEKSRAQIRISPGALKAVVQIRSVILVLVNLKPARRRGLFFLQNRLRKSPVRTGRVLSVLDFFSACFTYPA